MKEYQKNFIAHAISRGVLRFGEFTLKSGRKSPYFFNAGLFCTGRDLALLGRYYAEAIKESGISYDVLFGPAYKGIPIVSAAAVELSDRFDTDSPWCCNRKEAKDHGEGGNIVGSPLKGKVLLVDDVITAGTAIRESMEIIRKNGAELAGVIVALDRVIPTVKACHEHIELALCVVSRRDLTIVEVGFVETGCCLALQPCLLPDDQTVNVAA